MSAVIEVKNLCCQSGNQFLLKDINWQVQKGERWVVFGRNGCGKTTLLSIIAGVRDYTAGSLQVLGETYHDANIFCFTAKKSDGSAVLFMNKFIVRNGFPILYCLERPEDLDWMSRLTIRI